MKNQFDAHNEVRNLFGLFGEHQTSSNQFQYWFRILLVLGHKYCRVLSSDDVMPKPDTAHFIIARKYGEWLFRKRRKNRFVQSIKDKYKVLFMRSEAKKRVGSLGSVHAYTFWCSLSCENFIWPSRYAPNPIQSNTYTYTLPCLAYLSISFYIHYIWYYIIYAGMMYNVQFTSWSTLTGRKKRKRETLIMINGSPCCLLTHKKKKKNRIFFAYFIRVESHVQMVWVAIYVR